MADFRKLIYALALVVLFTGLTVSANAQGLFCDSLTATPQIIRAEGYTELVGDITLRCAATTAGVTTAAGNFVPAANVHVTILGTTVTSRTVATGFIEPLLMIDEPGKPPSTVPQTYCGKGGNDTGPSGAGVCQIIAPSNPNLTYDGSLGVQRTATGDFTSCAATAYSCGRPNIFQGRPDGVSGVVFPGVPFDPPGTTSSIRTIRITNIRIDATRFDPAAFSQITAVVTIEGVASVALQFNSTVVATVISGMGSTVVKADKGFLQCIGETSPGHGQSENITISEGFLSAWRPRNVGEYIDNYPGTHTLASWLVSGSPYQYNGTTTNNLTDTPQNIPDLRYFTETGFLLATGGGTEHGINKAGAADYGTRISFNVTAPPTGTTLTIPTLINLTNGTNTTGVMVMTGFTDPGTGAYTPVTTATFTIPAAGARVVFEVLFSDPFSKESAVVVGTLSYSAPVSDPAVGVLTQVGGATFAPFYASVGTDVNGIPRFKQSTGPLQDFVLIGKCSCSLLFPWVVSDSAYVTGFAVSNTSMDPTNSTAPLGPGGTVVGGYSAALQSGTTTLYYFGKTGSNPTVTGTAAQLATAPSATVPAGGFATFISPSGFAGYAIANSQFQYCHGVAFLFSTTPTIPPMSYLGLVMDGKVGPTTFSGSVSESGTITGTITSGSATPLQRTIQVFKDALDQ